MPSRRAGAKRVGIRVVRIDRELDLALLYGPGQLTTHSVQVGRRQGTTLVSMGYDSGRVPVTVDVTGHRGTNGPFLLTVRKPWHGRSGGPLVNASTGKLVGVVVGYTAREGVAVSLRTVRRFLWNER